jgi:hypothetical protein
VLWHTAVLTAQLEALTPRPDAIELAPEQITAAGLTKLAPLRKDGKADRFIWAPQNPGTATVLQSGLLPSLNGVYGSQANLTFTAGRTRDGH